MEPFYAILDRFRLIEMFGLILSIVAIWLAFRHLRGIRETTIKLEETQQSLSTRFIGQFPRFLPQINELLSRASVGIDIVCDFPGYGHYSDYNDWFDYRNLIEKKSDDDNISINLICFNEHRRAHCHNEQFSDATRTWQEWKKELEVKTQLIHFLSVHNSKTEIDALTQEQFAELLEKVDKQMLEGAFARAEKTEVDTYIPLYFWLIDEKAGRGEAIFSIPSFHDKQLEHGFYTSDSRLISALSAMKDRYSGESASQCVHGDKKTEILENVQD